MILHKTVEDCMSEFCLTTERLILRDMRLSDEDDFVSLSQRPDYQTYYDEQDCRAENYRYLTQLFVQQIGEKPRMSYQLATIDKHSKRFIGIACIRMEAHARAAIGFGLNPDWQGKGLMYESMQALMSHAETQWGVQQFYAYTLRQNSAAMKLCQRLGLNVCTDYLNVRYFKGQEWHEVMLERA